MDVLLVEDEPLVREVVAEFLEDAGLDVAEASSADAALAAVGIAPVPPSAPPLPPSVLVTDVNLGPASSMDGFALAAAMRRRWPALGVVVITGREGNLGRCADLAPHERHLLKPFAPAALVCAVRELAVPPSGASGR